MKSKTYEEFVEKFKPKKTTDDCYTPPEVYDAVLKYVGEIADIAGRPIVRPFYPGGDYENYDYPAGCIVIDNPPFSIYSKIVHYYMSRGIDFFLFGPSLSLCSVAFPDGVTCVLVKNSIRYENGAIIRTGFVTSLMPAYRMITSPRLDALIRSAQPSQAKKKNRWVYPENVTSSALLHNIADMVEFKIPTAESIVVSNLDFLRARKNKTYAAALLLTDALAAKLTAAKLTAAKLTAAKLTAAKLTAADDSIAIELSPRERAIIDNLARNT